MTQTHRPASLYATGTVAVPGRQPMAARPDRVPVSPLPNPRRFEARALDAGGAVVRVARALPAFALLADAFSAFTRGSLVTSVTGPVAIEDLVPGDRIHTSAHGPMPVLWVGATTVPPLDAQTPVFRIAADSFGPDRPMPDLLVGPSARLLRPVRSAPGGRAFVPVADFEDGESVFRLQVTAPTELYHIAFETQVTLRVNGVEVESFHPGPGLTGRESPDLIALLLSFFPGMDDIGDFGRLAHPRLNAGEFDPSRAA